MYKNLLKYQIYKLGAMAPCPYEGPPLAFTIFIHHSHYVHQQFSMMIQGASKIKL